MDGSRYDEWLRRLPPSKAVHLDAIRWSDWLRLHRGAPPTRKRRRRQPPPQAPPPQAQSQPAPHVPIQPEPEPQPQPQPGPAPLPSAATRTPPARRPPPLVDLLEERIATEPYRRFTPHWQATAGLAPHDATAMRSHDDREQWASYTGDAQVAQKIYEELVAARRGSLSRATPSQQTQGSYSSDARASMSGVRTDVHVQSSPSGPMLGSVEPHCCSSLSDAGAFSVPHHNIRLQTRRGSLGSLAGAGLSAYDEYAWRCRVAGRQDACTSSP